ncbi:MAG: hypothetical protein A2V66_03365 [Ignavibacteria bacterium RBG_13_36_8]|nr:MAG: hypothetical protein A2V66_03365 [Ignavibacteria bacterium RBG_13_36_8]
MFVRIEISNGELVDKITILELKLKNIKNNDEKLINVKKEYDILNEALKLINIGVNSNLYKKLYEINKKLWDIEDKIRTKERDKEFDHEFIELARSVYFTNDIRAKLKREIDVITESIIINEKSYEEY